jgi:hypothetical protein
VTRSGSAGFSRPPGQAHRRCARPDRLGGKGTCADLRAGRRGVRKEIGRPDIGEGHWGRAHAKSFFQPHLVLDAARCCGLHRTHQWIVAHGWRRTDRDDQPSRGPAWIQDRGEPRRRAWWCCWRAAARCGRHSV